MKTGTVVECIDDQGFLIPDHGPQPTKGGLYTIRDIEMFGGIKACSLIGFDPDGYFRICRFKVPAKTHPLSSRISSITSSALFVCPPAGCRVSAEGFGVDRLYPPISASKASILAFSFMFS
jgi:hypothetical protein